MSSILTGCPPAGAEGPGTYADAAVRSVLLSVTDVKGNAIEGLAREPEVRGMTRNCPLGASLLT